MYNVVTPFTACGSSARAGQQQRHGGPTSLTVIEPRARPPGHEAERHEREGGRELLSTALGAPLAYSFVSLRTAASFTLLVFNLAQRTGMRRPGADEGARSGDGLGAPAHSMRRCGRAHRDPGWRQPLASAVRQRPPSWRRARLKNKYFRCKRLEHLDTRGLTA